MPNRRGFLGGSAAGALGLAFGKKNVPPALDHPTPTADRKVAAFEAKLAAKGGLRQTLAATTGPRDYTIPALDLAAISTQYGMERALAPQWKFASFWAPLDATWPQYEAIRDAAIQRFIGTYTKQGWDALISNDYRPKVEPGVYPARDLYTGIALLDRREFVIGCWFTFRKPQPVRIEVPPSWREPYVVRG